MRQYEADLSEWVAPGTLRDRARRGACVPEPYVRTVTSQGSVWITLPGDTMSHMLTAGEAHRLFRELEDVV